MLNLNDNYICALDVGSSKISACLAQLKGRSLESIIFDTVPSKGVKQGAVVDSIELVGAIGKLIKNLRTKSGIKIKLIYTNVSGLDITTKRSRAIIPLAERGNKVITASDIEQVNEQARILGSSLEEEIIHIIPSSYTIDSKSGITNPIGLYSHKLEVDLYLICIKLSSLQSLTRVINQSGLEIKDLFFSGMISSSAVFGTELNAGINLFCDIGSDITELLIFSNGILKDIEILPFGGDNLTLRICDELKIPFELAEDIKRSYGIIGVAQNIPEDKEILVKKSNLYKPIKQRMVSEIITASAAHICAQIKQAIDRKVSSYEVDNLFVVGRTVLLEGFIEMLENKIEIPVKLGRINDPRIVAMIKEDHALAGPKYLTYLTALSMLSEVIRNKPTGIIPAYKPAKNLILKAVNRFREVYQEYF